MNLQSVMTALNTLYAAHKYMCPGLAKQVRLFRLRQPAFFWGVGLLITFKVATSTFILRRKDEHTDLLHMTLEKVFGLQNCSDLLLEVNVLK